MYRCALFSTDSYIYTFMIIRINYEIITIGLNCFETAKLSLSKFRQCNELKFVTINFEWDLVKFHDILNCLNPDE